MTRLTYPRETDVKSNVGYEVFIRRV